MLWMKDGGFNIGQDELKGFSRTIAEIERLLLILVLLQQVSQGEASVTRGGVLLSLLFFGGFVMAFRYANLYRTESRWKLAIETWVMSCRAFARRIEQQTLKMLFASTGAEEVDFDFVPTSRNGPLQEFLAAVGGEQPTTEFRLRRAQFDGSCPKLYHAVRELRRAEAHG